MAFAKMLESNAMMKYLDLSHNQLDESVCEILKGRGVRVLKVGEQIVFILHIIQNPMVFPLPQPGSKRLLLLGIKSRCTNDPQIRIENPLETGSLCSQFETKTSLSLSQTKPFIEEDVGVSSPVGAVLCRRVTIG